MIKEEDDEDEEKDSRRGARGELGEQAVKGRSDGPSEREGPGSVGMRARCDKDNLGWQMRQCYCISCFASKHIEAAAGAPAADPRQAA
jgi:hypothetical protein